MAYSAPAYRFLIFGKVEKEWEEDHMNFHAFVHNATGFTCWEEEISVRGACRVVYLCVVEMSGGGFLIDGTDE